ncbi:MAG: homoserine dehydrogenase, partial [Akkermansiaceae bacterium]
MSSTTSGIGLAGFGTVGSGVWKILARNGELIQSRAQGSVELAIRKICVRDLSKPRDVDAPAHLFTTDLM